MKTIWGFIVHVISSPKTISRRGMHKSDRFLKGFFWLLCSKEISGARVEVTRVRDDSGWSRGSDGEGEAWLDLVHF